MLSRVFERNKKNERVIELIRDWNLIPLSSLENLNETETRRRGYSEKFFERALHTLVC